MIAADAGLRYLEEQGIRADLVIGDFDTLKCIPEHPNAIALSAEKDDTDTLAAVREGIRAGYTSFHIYCGTGGRMCLPHNKSSPSCPFPLVSHIPKIKFQIARLSKNIAQLFLVSFRKAPTLPICNIPCGNIKGNPALLFYPELCYGYRVGGSAELSESVRYDG